MASTSRWDCIPIPLSGIRGGEIGNEGRAGQQGGFIGQEVVTAGKLRLNRNIASQQIRQAEYAGRRSDFVYLPTCGEGFTTCL